MRYFVAVAVAVFSLHAEAQTKLAGSLRYTEDGGAGAFRITHLKDFEYPDVLVGFRMNSAYGLTWTDDDGATKRTDRVEVSLKTALKRRLGPFMGIDIRSDWLEAIQIATMYNINHPRSMRLKAGGNGHWHGVDVALAAAVEKREILPDVDLGVELSPEYKLTLKEGGTFTTTTKMFYGLENLLSVRTYNSLSFLFTSAIHLTFDFNLFVEQYHLQDTEIDRELLAGFSYEF